MKTRRESAIEGVKSTVIDAMHKINDCEDELLQRGAYAMHWLSKRENYEPKTDDEAQAFVTFVESGTLTNHMPESFWKARGKLLKGFAALQRKEAP